MTGIVLVSHSRPLADAALALAQGLVPGLDVPVAVAAGLDGGELGTDATAVLEAITGLLEGGADDVLLLADIGSGVMSAHMALELLEAMDPDAASSVRLSPAPLVEGLLAAYAAAGTGQDFAQVVQAADQAAQDKRRAVTG